MHDTWGQLLLVLYQTFLNFAGVFVMVSRCACALRVILSFFINIFDIVFQVRLVLEYISCGLNSSYSFPSIIFVAPALAGRCDIGVP